MTEEEKEAIKSFKEENDNDLSRFEDFNDYTQFKIKRDNTILNLIQELQEEIEHLKNINKHQSKDIKKAVDYTFELNKELEKKDKMIDEMVNYIYATDYRSECGNSRQQVKQYFERKVEV